MQALADIATTLGIHDTVYTERLVRDPQGVAEQLEALLTP